MFLKRFWTRLKKALSKTSSYLALFFIAFYRAFLSGTLGCGGACRFYPSCSEYALLVYKKQTFLKATFFVLRRLLACHPLGPKIRLEPELKEENFLYKT